MEEEPDTKRSVFGISTRWDPPPRNTLLVATTELVPMARDEVDSGPMRSTALSPTFAPAKRGAVDTTRLATIWQLANHAWIPRTAPLASVPSGATPASMISHDSMRKLVVAG